jgi:hypothetical protein
LVLLAMSFYLLKQDLMRLGFASTYSALAAGPLRVKQASAVV